MLGLKIEELKRFVVAVNPIHILLLLYRFLGRSCCATRQTQ
jgi:hypothetical protein